MNFSCVRKIPMSYVKYGLMVATKDFNLPKGEKIKVYFYDGEGTKRYIGKTHNKDEGKIEGLTALYKDTGLKEGDYIKIVYSKDKTEILVYRAVIKKLSETEAKYHILTGLSKLRLPEDTEVVTHFGKRVEKSRANSALMKSDSKVHATIKGRVDRLSDFYAYSGMQAGDTIIATCRYMDNKWHIFVERYDETLLKLDL